MRQEDREKLGAGVIYLTDVLKDFSGHCGEQMVGGQEREQEDEFSSTVRGDSGLHCNTGRGKSEK